MPQWRARMQGERSPIPDDHRGATITTPYGEQIRADIRNGVWELPPEAFLGMAGIHAPAMRARCLAALRDKCVRDPDQRGLMGIHPYALLRILLQHGGRRPPKVDLPVPPSSMHEHCTTEVFDAMMADVAAMWIDDETSSRYEDWLVFCHDLLEEKRNVRDGLFLSVMVTSRLEHWGDGAIHQLPQAIAYAISVHPAWRRAAVTWLMPHRHTWTPDYLRRMPNVRAMVRLAAKKVPGVPTWLHRP